LVSTFTLTAAHADEGRTPLGTWVRSQ